MRTRLSEAARGGLFTFGLGLTLAVVGTASTHARGESDRASSNGDSPAAQYTVKATPEGKAVYRDGELLTEYITLSGRKPILWPVIGPDGVAMTRSYPMGPTKEQEREDHIHHRSFWFTHGEVNGIDFWAETENGGTTKHREFTAVEEGSTAKISTTNDWVGPDGKRVLSDERTLVFGDDGGHRYIDVDITLKATDGPVHFGDTKEGSFGLRLAGTMKLDAEPGGSILTSRGVKDAKAWGTEAEWVDYVGPIDGKTYGVTIMNHPSSFGFPNRWHVRSYGLFAANPFGQYHFTGGEPTDGVRLEAGDSLRLRYRVVLHRGDSEQAQIAQAWKRYEATE
ncbi:DUF6807 domain-containing protein [Candidatus Laterigemmans baculatus]|uniref:DUF6807 domain-containing protein n=1 Tax=Candidatus Laterigemmans baculatus TaxID=2770505 RepID=UPI0013DB66B3|nr:PmoA family protein [Candidatus Laterigemmans baculatus]